MCDVCLIADQLSKVWRAEEADILVTNPTTGGWLVRFDKHTAPLGQGGIGASGFYKHAAPLGREDWGPGLLQTCCPAGAGRLGPRASTNMLPRWGRAGSGPRASTNMLPRWGRKIGAPGFYKHTAPLGQGRIGASGFYKHAAPLGQERRYRGEAP